MHIIFVVVLGYLAIIAMVVVGGLLFQAFVSVPGTVVLVALVAAGLLYRLHRAHRRAALALQHKVNDHRQKVELQKRTSRS